MTMQEIFLWLDATRITDTTSILAKVMKNMANLVGTLICYCMLRKHDLDNTGGLEMYPWPQDLESVSFENVSSNFAANQPPPTAYHDPHAGIETPPPGQDTNTIFFLYFATRPKYYFNERSLAEMKPKK